MKGVSYEIIALFDGCTLNPTGRNGQPDACNSVDEKQRFCNDIFYSNKMEIKKC